MHLLLERPMPLATARQAVPVATLAAVRYRPHLMAHRSWPMASINVRDCAGLEFCCICCIPECRRHGVDAPPQAGASAFLQVPLARLPMPPDPEQEF